MAMVMFANLKGGSGKTTASMVFAGEIHAAGGRVALFEGDPNGPMRRWAKNRHMPVIDGETLHIASKADALAILEREARGHKLVVIHDPSEEHVFEWIEAATSWGQFVVADPEGSPNQWLQDVAGQADLVIVPLAPSGIEAHQVSNTINLLARVVKRTGRQVPYRVLLTNTLAIPTREEIRIRAQLKQNALPQLDTTLQQRPGYRTMFTLDKSLAELDPAEVNGLEGARRNAASLTKEIVGTLKELRERRAA